MTKPQVEQTEFGESAHFVNLTFSRALSESEIGAIARQSAAVYSMRLPARVAAAYARAADLKFRISSTPVVGSLLAVLGAAVPPNGRILELGTGAGVGLAWIVHGLESRTDATVTSIEVDHDLLKRVADQDWPPQVALIEGDGLQLLGSLGQFDLIFADTVGQDTHDVRPFVAALRPGGILVIDDLIHTVYESPERKARLDRVRQQLFGDSHLCCTELRVSSGVVLAARRH